jgi:hypothetical protein
MVVKKLLILSLFTHNISFFPIQKKCQNVTSFNDIEPRNVLYVAPDLIKRNELFTLLGKTLTTCLNKTASTQKMWLIYTANELTGVEMQQIQLKTNPSLTTSQLVIQPQTLSYGLYKIVYALSMSNRTSKAHTYVRIIPSGLVLSTLKTSKGMYGGTIEITRGWNQTIAFNPFLNTFDIDRVCVITSLSFKYTCRLLHSNGLSSSTNTSSDFLSQFNSNECFNKTSN